MNGIESHVISIDIIDSYSISINGIGFDTIPISIVKSDTISIHGIEFDMISTNSTYNIPVCLRSIIPQTRINIYIDGGKKKKRSIGYI